MLLRVIAVGVVAITGGVRGARSGHVAAAAAFLLRHLAEHCGTTAGVRHQHPSHRPATKIAIVCLFIDTIGTDCVAIAGSLSNEVCFQFFCIHGFVIVYTSLWHNSTPTFTVESKVIRNEPNLT